MGDVLLIAHALASSIWLTFFSPQTTTLFSDQLAYLIVGLFLGLGHSKQ